MSHISAQESYLEAYVKFLYYNCLIPYKPVWKSDENLLVHEGKGIQKVLCIIIQSFVFFYIFHKLLTFQETLRSSPLVLFSYAHLVLGVFVLLTWNICFWRRTSQLTKLVYKTSTYGLFPDSIFFKIKKIALFISPAVIAMLGYLSELKVSNGRVILPYNTDKTLLFISGFKLQNVFLLLKQIPLCFSIYMGACFDIISVTIAISAYDFTNTHFSNMKTASSLKVIPLVIENKPNIKNMVTAAKEIQLYFGNLNDFYSNLFLLWFCIQFPWIPLQMVRIYGIDEYGIFDIISILFTFLCTSFYVTTGLLFSESRKKVIQFKTDAIEYLLKDPYNADANHNLVKYFEVTLEDAIIKGGNFVRISYEFLGSVVSALIGYGFLVLQFRSSSSATLSNPFEVGEIDTKT